MSEEKKAESTKSEVNNASPKFDWKNNVMKPAAGIAVGIGLVLGYDFVKGKLAKS